MTYFLLQCIAYLYLSAVSGLTFEINQDEKAQNTMYKKTFSAEEPLMSPAKAS